MLLAVDIGNTMIKAAVFEDAVLVEKFVFDKSGAAAEVQNIFEKHPGISRAAVPVAQQAGD